MTAGSAVGSASRGSPLQQLALGDCGIATDDNADAEADRAWTGEKSSGVWLFSSSLPQHSDLPEAHPRAKPGNPACELFSGA